MAKTPITVKKKRDTEPGLEEEDHLKIARIIILNVSNLPAGIQRLPA